MKRISHIRELMLSAVFITLVLGATAIGLAENAMEDSDFEEHRLKEEAAWINKRLENAECGTEIQNRPLCNAYPMSGMRSNGIRIPESK